MSERTPLTVDTDMVRARARTVARDEDAVRAGVAAAHSAIGSECFGRLCGFLVPRVAQVQAEVADFTADLAGALRDEGEVLRTTAEEYEMVDEFAALLMRTLERNLG